MYILCVKCSVYVCGTPVATLLDVVVGCFRNSIGMMFLFIALRCALFPCCRLYASLALLLKIWKFAFKEGRRVFQLSIRSHLLQQLLLSGTYDQTPSPQPVVSIQIYLGRGRFLPDRFSYSNKMILSPRYFLWGGGDRLPLPLAPSPPPRVHCLGRDPPPNVFCCILR